MINTETASGSHSTFQIVPIRKLQRGKILDPRVRQFVVARREAVGLTAATRELNSVIVSCNADPTRLSARNSISKATNDKNHRFHASWHTWFGVWSGAIGNTVEVQTRPMLEVAPEPSVERASTDIVRVVDGISFRLPESTLAGAEQARVTLTDLATALGYSDKAQLKLLAGRHSQEIAEFGQTFTVKVWVTGGVAPRQIDEPTYNPEQAAYLALSSETPQGRACRVRILKAYKSLLAEFERVVTAPAPVAAPAIDYQALALIVGTAVSSAMSQTIERLIPTRRRKSPQTVAQLNPAQIPLPVVNQPEPAQTKPLAPAAQSEPQDASDREILAGMIKRLAAVKYNMPKLEFKARMSIAYESIAERLLDFGHDMYGDMSESKRNGQKVNSLDWIESKGIVRLTMRIVEELHAAKEAAK